MEGGLRTESFTPKKKWEGEQTSFSQAEVGGWVGGGGGAHHVFGKF